MSSLLLKATYIVGLLVVSGGIHVSNCNDVSVEERIHGGYWARKPEDAPGVVYIDDADEADQQWCAGALISAYYVLSAAHCFDAFDHSTLFVRAGSTYRYNSGGLTRSVEAVVSYEKYEQYKDLPERILFNIAMLRLAEPLDRADNVGHFQISAKQPGVGSTAKYVIAGWGDAEGGDGTVNLKTGTVELTSMQACAKVFLLKGMGERDTASLLCSKSEAGLCYGDSGGPLYLRDILYGISLYSYRFKPPYDQLVNDCERSYSAYLNVFAFRGWIRGQRNYYDLNNEFLNSTKNNYQFTNSYHDKYG
ncbi:trypsin alpha-like [Chrysoperla carnea]|uniref:trypsin alpha-like n=1 Tax=Chrysoperla carnea TaxID=189513 RepID=UPI001D06AFE2|nr:trypsin alpha-like [Chrysoperla carnea]